MNQTLPYLNGGSLEMTLRPLKIKGGLKVGGSKPTVINIFQGSRVPIPSQKKMA